MKYLAIILLCILALVELCLRAVIVLVTFFLALVCDNSRDGFMASKCFELAGKLVDER